MKKSFFPSLLCVALSIFTFISCSQNPDAYSDVTITFPVKELYNVLAARSGDTDITVQESVENYNHTGILTIDLYVNDNLSPANSKSQTITYGAVKKQENLSFVFADIEIGSKVQAKASITVDDLIVCKGESESMVLQNDVLELELILELVNKNSGTDNPSTGEGTSSGGGNTSGEGTTGSDVEINCNIYLRYYAKESLNSTEDYTLLESFGGQTTYTFAQIDNNPYLLNTNDDLYSQSMWFEFTKNIGGYVYASEVENSDEESVGVTIDDAGIIYVDYYLIKEKPVSECKNISGVSGQNNYTLKLYSIGDYEICNSSGDSILIGMWSTTEVTGRVGFSEFMYQKDGKKALSPHFYKDGELVMSGDDPRFDLKTDVVNFNAASGTFTLKYYDDEHDNENTAIPITFTIPQNFDIAAFEDHNNGDDPALPSMFPYGRISVTGPTVALVDITATPSQDFCLNYGAVTLKATTKENEDVTDDVTWKVRMLYGGVDINSYGISYYSLDSTDKQVLLNNKLIVAGTYQLYITATYNGFVNSKVIDVTVDNSEVYGCDISELQTVARNISSPAKITLSGELDSNSGLDEISSILSSITQNFELDMHEVTGATELGEGSFAIPHLISLILPQSITKICAQAFADDQNNRYCQNLEYIGIPASITEIEEGAFFGCSSLSSIVFTTPYSGSGSSTSSNDGKYTVDNTGCLCKINGSDKTLLFIPTEDLVNLTQVSFADDFAGVTKLGASVFYGSENLTSVDFANSNVTSIGDYAFNNCENLTEINLSGIKNIGEYAFADCNLNYSTQALDFSGVETIGANAFYDNSNLKKIDNYNDLTSVGDYAFNSQLDEFIIDDTLKNQLTLGNSALNVQSLIINYTSITAEDIEKINISASSLVLNSPIELPDLTGDSFDTTKSSVHSGALFKKFMSVTSITFNNTENFKIGDYQFANFRNLKTITTNGGKINEVGNYAFYSKNTASSANKLSSIDLTACTKIGDSAFQDCVNLKVEHVNQNDTDTLLDLSNVQTFGKAAFKNTSSSTNSSYSTYHVKIASIDLGSATSIGEEAFYGWTELTTITQLGASTGCSIGKNAFATNVTAGIKLATIGSTTGEAHFDNVTSIGESAFQNCRSLTKVVFGNVFDTTIGSSAFSNCSALASVDFGTKVSRIGVSAFANCPITSLDFTNTAVTVIDEGAFQKVSGTSSLTSLNLGNTITHINHKAFLNNSVTGTITIPASVVAIGYNVFAKNSGEPSISFATVSGTQQWYKITTTDYDTKSTIWNNIMSQIPNDDLLINISGNYEEETQNNVESGLKTKQNAVQDAPFYFRIINGN